MDVHVSRAVVAPVTLELLLDGRGGARAGPPVRFEGVLEILTAALDPLGLFQVNRLLARTST